MYLFKVFSFLLDIFDYISLYAVVNLQCNRIGDYLTLSCLGGNKWTRTSTIIAYVSSETFPDALASGGNKWTRTTDLTLIRRVL